MPVPYWSLSSPVMFLSHPGSTYPTHFIFPSKRPTPHTRFSDCAEDYRKTKHWCSYVTYFYNFEFFSWASTADISMTAFVPQSQLRNHWENWAMEKYILLSICVISLTQRLLQSPDLSCMKSWSSLSGLLQVCTVASHCLCRWTWFYLQECWQMGFKAFIYVELRCF